MAGEPAVSWKLNAAGSAQPTASVRSDGQAGGPHELDGLRAVSLAAHRSPTLPANVMPARQPQPPPMLLAQTPLARVTYSFSNPPTGVSKVLLTIRAAVSCPMFPCRTNP